MTGGMDLSRDVQMGAVTVEPEQAFDALGHLLDQPDAHMLAEAMGMRGYWGHNYDGKSRRRTAAWREGSLA